jgi:S-adenosylmethionine hydrolase
VQSIICFVSDFGTDDTWVGVCHAVILKACPHARVVDLGHHVPAFDVRKGAATAAAGVHQLPDAIHLIVVDPGVGPGRRDICLVTERGALLVGPDNGVLIPASRRAGGIRQAFAIDSAKIDFRSPLATFHARDVLAPAAAALACGVQPSSLGELIDPAELVEAPFGECHLEGAYVVGEVLESDRFGSLRFNVPVEDIESLGLRAKRLEIALGHNSLVVPFGRTYADVPEGEPVALVDSSGWLTLAVNQGDARDRYGAGSGTKVRIIAVSERVSSA